MIHIQTEAEIFLIISKNILHKILIVLKEDIIRYTYYLLVPTNDVTIIISKITILEKTFKYSNKLKMHKNTHI